MTKNEMIKLTVKQKQQLSKVDTNWYIANDVLNVEINGKYHTLMWIDDGFWEYGIEYNDPFNCCTNDVISGIDRFIEIVTEKAS